MALALLPAAAAAAPPATDPPGETAAAPPPRTVVVTVDGTEITQEQIDGRVAALYGRRLSQAPAAQQAAMRQQAAESVREGLVSKTLLLHAAAAAKIGVEGAEVTQALQKMKGSVPPGVTFDDYLKSIGLTEAQLKQEVEDEVRINSLIERRTATLPQPSEAEVKAFYSGNPQFFQTEPKVRARHVLISTDGASGEAALTQKKASAEALRAQLVESGGKDFAEVAQKHSDCPSKARGGDLGEFGRGQMVAAFENAAFDQAIDAVGPVIKTQFGYHIIQVQSKTEGGMTPLPEVKEKITSHLAGQAREKAVGEFIDELRAKAKIVESAK